VEKYANAMSNVVTFSFTFFLLGLTETCMIIMVGL
jgi:hypothetical protein